MFWKLISFKVFLSEKKWHIYWPLIQQASLGDITRADDLFRQEAMPKANTPITYSSQSSMKA